MTVVHISSWRTGEASSARHRNATGPDHHITTDGVWMALRDPDLFGSAWAVEHRPTALLVGGESLSTRTFGSLADALLWIGRPDAVRLLQEQAVAMLSGPRVSEAAEARAALAVWGIPLIGPGGLVEVEHHCVCGGYLTRVDGALVHVDVCADELRPGRGMSGTCPDMGARHRICLDPEAVQCEHAGCHSPNRYDVSPCPRDLMCCSCCLSAGD